MTSRLGAGLSLLSVVGKQMRTSILGFVAAAGSFAFLGVASPAEAASEFISVSGVWGPEAPDTPFSAPDAAFTFGFELPDPFSENPTTQFSRFSYFLNVVQVTGQTLLKVQFFPTDEAGMFDLIFQSGDVVSLYGADIGSSLTISSGTYPGPPECYCFPPLV